MSFFSLDQFQFMAWWLTRVALSRAPSVQVQQGVEQHCPPNAILCGTDLVGGLTRVLYIAALSITFFFRISSVVI